MTPALCHFSVFAAFAFCLGACVASFLNVCIWRLPRGESVVRPGSHCPKCNAPIRWWQNIPVLSWCCLRGRCANCREPISVRYTVVELLGGILFLMAYLQWAMPAILGREPVLMMTATWNPWMMAAEALVAAGLILGSFIDLEHFYLPDRVTVGGILLGIPASWLIPELQGETTGVAALEMSLAGAAGGFFSFWIMRIVFSRIFRKEALGFGDVKLLGAIGAFFGPWAVLFTVMASSFAGAAAGIAMIARGRARLGGFTAVPYGPFLAAGALVWMYWGPSLMRWYLGFATGSAPVLQ